MYCSNAPNIFFGAQTDIFKQELQKNRFLKSAGTQGINCNKVYTIP